MSRLNSRPGLLAGCPALHCLMALKTGICSTEGCYQLLLDGSPCADARGLTPRGSWLPYCLLIACLLALTDGVCSRVGFGTIQLWNTASLQPQSVSSAVYITKSARSHAGTGERPHIHCLAVPETCIGEKVPSSEPLQPGAQSVAHDLCQQIYMFQRLFTSTLTWSAVFATVCYQDQAAQRRKKCTSELSSRLSSVRICTSAV